MFKNMTKEILKNKIFLALLFLMTICTSFMFFFIRFSIDANLSFLQSLTHLTQNQQNYLRALTSNSSLALSMLLTITGVTALVFALFYLRIFSSTKKQIGILKALGYKNINFQVYFTVFAIVFSVFGLLVGLIMGYFGSSIHIDANSASYGVLGLIKGISFGGVVLGIFLPLFVFAITLFLCGFKLYSKQNSELLSSTTSQNVKHNKLLKFADACVQRFPIKNKAPLRIALRRPMSGIFIIGASMVFTVMLVLGWSLAVSGENVYESQTVGHNYKYEAGFNTLQTHKDHTMQGNVVYYISLDGLVVGSANYITQTIMGMDFNNAVYSLQNIQGGTLPALENNNCYISQQLLKMYKIKIGDEISLLIGETPIKVRVQDVAYNAKAATIMLARAFLAEQMVYEKNSFNGVLSIDNLFPNADSLVDSKTKENELNRNKVSSAVSAVINQSIGILSGIILIFLALFITFQDSNRDMMILSNLGYKSKEIKRLLINVFLPILIIGYVLTVFPAVLIAQAVQFSLSLQTGDYMPFSTNILVLLIGLIAVVAIYFAVQAIFSLAIKHALKKKSILHYTNKL